ncbi:MAG: FGGY family carbohydrate kinase [Parvibaculaceae bacterium]
MIAWYCARTVADGEALRDRLGDETVFRTSGVTASPSFGLAKILWWRRNHPRILAKARFWLNMAGWVAFRLTGEARTDTTLASRTNALDLERGTWAVDLLRRLAIDPALFAPLIGNGAPVGRVHKRAAAERQIPLTAVTNSLETAGLAAACPSWRVIVPGGTVRTGSQMMVGEPGVSFFGTIHADLCLVGAYALTGRILSDASLEVASLKRAMIGSARRAILLIDSSKFRAPSFSAFCDISAISEVITDDGADPAQLTVLRALDVEVTVANAL